ncbi:MAG TPA: ABC-2 family transporter protein [Phycisphaerae bacterium]|nr:ABC-2 family transporter protein [Phycisphaerae bacterium]HOJ73617.1 ABC-2 family transporter protein [Phycisphaerae bacterium]HOM51574.1 ABC-2 family transporter protein [Phycisphaerae bacterium]HON68026.1 ABC-2 family transporter protein [Phycisphaerae bacterium]HOQ88112.1 ABC-2 family transporter protein [Phycisphaerae bacterium]
MLRYLKLILLFTRVSVQDSAAYRTDFIAHVLVTLANFGAELVGLWTIFSNTRSLNGWGVFEMVALLGVFRMVSGLIGLTIAPNMRLIMDDIREGKLDFVILKPVNSQFFVSFRRVVVWRLADITLGILLVVIACVKMASSITAGHVFMFIAMLLAGGVIIYSFWLVLATLAFWLTRVNNMEMVFWNVFEAGRYPVDIYRPMIRRALTYIVPLAFITTFPAGALVGRTQLSGLALAVLFAVGSLAVASSFWRYGLRHYSGASA